MAATLPSCAQAGAPSSAWGRLVQMTRTASKNSRPDANHATRQSAAISAKSSLVKPPVPPAKTRRAASPSSRYAPTQSLPNSSPQAATRIVQQASAAADSTPSSRTQDAPPMPYPSGADADCITVCLCQEDTVRSQDSECGASQRRKPRRKLRTSEPSPPGPGDIRTFWVRGSSEKGITRQTQVAATNQDTEVEHCSDEQDCVSRESEASTPSRTPLLRNTLCDMVGLPTEQHSRPRAHDSSASRTRLSSPEASGATFQHDPYPIWNKIRQDTQEGAVVEQEEDQRIHETPRDAGRTRMEATRAHARDLALGDDDDDDVVVDMAADCPGQASAAPALTRTSQPAVGGLQGGDQNSLNKMPRSERLRIYSSSKDNITQLDTPSSSPVSKVHGQARENEGDSTDAVASAPAAKAKRRLTLHGGRYDSQHSQKKRKTPPLKKDAVQTTLSLTIGGTGGMKECKLCDTVYNPFHPDDIKVHAKRHAVILRRGVGF